MNILLQPVNARPIPRFGALLQKEALTRRAIEALQLLNSSAATPGSLVERGALFVNLATTHLIRVTTWSRALKRVIKQLRKDGAADHAILNKLQDWMAFSRTARREALLLSNGPLLCRSFARILKALKIHTLGFI